MIISGCQKLSRTSRSCGEQQSRAAKDAGQERVFNVESNENSPKLIRAREALTQPLLKDGVLIHKGGWAMRSQITRS